MRRTYMSFLAFKDVADVFKMTVNIYVSLTRIVDIVQFLSCSLYVKWFAINPTNLGHSFLIKFIRSTYILIVSTCTSCTALKADHFYSKYVSREVPLLCQNFNYSKDNWFSLFVTNRRPNSVISFQISIKINLQSL